MKKLVLFLLAFAVAVAFGAARPDIAHASGDNAAVAINTKDGSSVFRLAFSIRRVAGDVVDNTNAAVAYSNCEGCKSVAIAVQIVLVTGNPSVVTPTNLALAVNYECTLCETFAAAYQFVIGGNGQLTFTPEGLRELNAIRHELGRLKKEDLSTAELKARVDELMNRLKSVLETQLVPVGDGRAALEGEDTVEAADEDLPAERRPRGGSTENTQTTETVRPQPQPQPSDTETAPAETTTTTPAETTTTTPVETVTTTP